MNVVDSSGWLEYYAGGENRAFFAPVIQQVDALIVPTISLYEGFKRIVESGWAFQGDLNSACSFLRVRI